MDLVNKKKKKLLIKQSRINCRDNSNQEKEKSVKSCIQTMPLGDMH